MKPAARRRLVRAAVFSAFLLVVATAARAQDAPVATPHTDADKTVEVRLPAGWAEDTKDPWVDEIVSWRGRLGGDESGHGAVLVVRRQRKWTSAQLRLGRTLSENDPMEDDLRRSGDRWVEAAYGRDDGADDAWNLGWQRCIESGGQVVIADLRMRADQPADCAAEAQALLDSVRVLKSPPADVPPDGWKRATFSGFVVYAENPRGKAVQKMVKYLAKSRGIIAKALPGKPHDREPPVVYLYETTMGMVRGSGLDPEKRHPPVAHRMNQRPLHAVVGDPDDDDVLGRYLHQQAARQYVWQYFGGFVPEWLGSGLAMYAAGGAMGSGPSKPPKYFYDYAQERVAISRSLASWIDVPPKWDDDKMAMEIWAWHVFFRHGKAKAAAKKAYKAYIKTLRETGDLRAARRQFDDIDDKSLLAAYRKWVQAQ